MSFSRFQNTFRRGLSSSRVISAAEMEQLHHKALVTSIEKFQEGIRGMVHSKRLTNDETLTLYGDLVQSFVQDRLYKKVIDIFRVLPNHGFTSLTSEDVQNFKRYLKDDEWIDASPFEYGELESSHYTMFETLKEKVIWTPPKEGFIKLNTDGSIDKYGQGTIGGLFRDSSGKMLLGFYMHVGYVGAHKEIFKVEVRAIQEGIKLAFKHGYTKIQLETDNKDIADILQKKEEAEECKAELEGITRFIDSRLPGSEGPVHIYRKANECADALADIAFDMFSSESEIQTITDPDPFNTLKRRLRYDQRRMNG